MDQAEVSRAAAGSEEMGQEPRRADERGLAAAYGGAAATDPGRRPGKRFRGREGIFHLAGTEKIQAARTRVFEPVSRLRDVPGVRRYEAAR